MLAPKKMLGYTVLMGVLPKVQPICIGSHKMLGYTVLMGVSPKVQHIYATIIKIRVERKWYQLEV